MPASLNSPRSASISRRSATGLRSSAFLSAIAITLGYEPTTDPNGARTADHAQRAPGHVECPQVDPGHRLDVQPPVDWAEGCFHVERNALAGRQQHSLRL